MELKRYWQIVCKRYRTLLWIMGVIVLTVIVGSLLATPVYKFYCKVYIRSSDNKASFVSGLPTDTATLGYITTDLVMEGQLSLIQNISLLDEVARSLKLEKRKGVPYTGTDLSKSGSLTLALRKLGVSSKVIQNTQIIMVEGYSSNPQQAVDLANEVARQFVIFYHQYIQGEAGKAYQYIETRIPQVHAKLQDAENALYQFQMANQTSNISYYREKLLGGLTTLEESQETVVREVVESEKKIQQILEKIKKVPEFKQTTTTYQINPRIDYIGRKITDSEVEFASLSAKVTPKHLLALQERAKLQDLKDQMRKQVKETFNSRSVGRNSYYDTLLENLGTAEINRAVFRARMLVYEQQVGDKKKQLADLSQKEKEQLDLERRVAALKTTFTNLLSNKQTAHLAMDFPLSNAQVVEWAALPATKAEFKSYRWFPKRKILVSLAVILSLFLGLTVIFLQEYLDDTLSDPQEAEAALHVPVLGPLPELPLLDSPSAALLMGLPAWERAVTLLGAMLQSTDEMPVPGVLAVTSARAQEGKSLVAASLGQVLARENHRVLLIELNFSHPSLESLWQLPRQNGVAEILRGTSSTTECLRPLGRELFLISAGQAGGITLSKKNQAALASWLASLKTEFNVIILDLPAVGEGEGALFTALADQTLVVAAAQRTSRTLVARALEHLTRCRAQVKGLVLNGVRPDSLGLVRKELVARWESWTERLGKFKRLSRW